MGNCGSKPSTREATAKSDAIDKELEEDAKRYKKECKILLLGSGESGKSTIVKQMKIIHQGGFTLDERLSYRPIVYRNVVDSAQALVAAMKKLGLSCVNEGNQVLAEEILVYRLPKSTGVLDLTEPPLFSSSIADAINQVWQDPIVKRIMDEHSSEFYLMDSAS